MTESAPRPFAVRLDRLEAAMRQLAHDTNVIDDAIARLQIQANQTAAQACEHQARIHACESALLAARDTIKTAAQAIQALQDATDTLTEAVAEHCKTLIAIQQREAQRAGDHK